MPSDYNGDGYEFSVRLLNHRRLFIHVTRATLEFLARGQSSDQFATLASCIDFLRERAIMIHAQTGCERVVLDPCDLAEPSSAGVGAPPRLQ